ncbi:MAG: hypothetical protein DI539_21725 [Flavobacterium psychrophilum]|nr:MAG: hypothetical protein DI539_21725 [Flavobacterium psychrophilum]
MNKPQTADIEKQFIGKQIEVCRLYNAPYIASPFDKIAGIARRSFDDKTNMPINGLRLPVENEQSANWYIWAGEYSEADDFFEPVHLYHLIDFCPNALKFLGLAPGWRFLFDDKGYEDVWHDEQLLNT